jgi:hypothetical protein
MPSSAPLEHEQDLNAASASAPSRSVLMALKAEGKLPPSREWIDWFDQQLARLPHHADAFVWQHPPSMRGTNDRN